MKYHHPKLPEQLFFFLSGALVSTPLPSFYRKITRYLESMRWDPFWVDVFTSTAVAPFFEEFAKAYPLFYRHGESEKSLFRLGFLIGLGFGLVEFCIYVFAHHVPVIDRLPGVLFHATNTSIIAYGIAKNKALKYYFIAVGLHLINNLSASFDPYWYYIGIPAILTSYSLSFYLSRKVTYKIVEY